MDFMLWNRVINKKALKYGMKFNAFGFYWYCYNRKLLPCSLMLHIEYICLKLIYETFFTLQFNNNFDFHNVSSNSNYNLI